MLQFFATAEENHEAARFHHDYWWCGGGGAVRCDGAGSGANLPLLVPFPRDAPVFLRFLDELRHQGFIEGQNLTIDYRDFALHGDLSSEYAAELVKAQVDVIWAGGGVPIRAVQQATKTIPIFGVTNDMVGEGLVASLARPNGNTTGGPQDRQCAGPYVAPDITGARRRGDRMRLKKPLRRCIAHTCRHVVACERRITDRADSNKGISSAHHCLCS